MVWALQDFLGIRVAFVNDAEAGQENPGGSGGTTGGSTGGTGGTTGGGYSGDGTENSPGEGNPGPGGSLPGGSGSTTPGTGYAGNGTEDSPSEDGPGPGGSLPDEGSDNDPEQPSLADLGIGTIGTSGLSEYGFAALGLPTPGVDEPASGFTNFLGNIASVPQFADHLYQGKTLLEDGFLAGALLFDKNGLPVVAKTVDFLDMVQSKVGKTLFAADLVVSTTYAYNTGGMKAATINVTDKVTGQALSQGIGWGFGAGAASLTSYVVGGTIAGGLVGAVIGLGVGLVVSVAWDKYVSESFKAGLEKFGSNPNIDAPYSDPMTGFTVPPVILDLDGDGVELKVAGASPAMADLDGDGYASHIGWVGEDDGILAIDLDGDGDVSDLKEFAFAYWTEDEDDTDLEALATLFDANNDGVLNALDPAYQHLKIWQDADGDAATTASELKTLAAAGIVSIDLHKSGQSTVLADGTTVHGVAQYTRSDGQVYDAADVSFGSTTVGTKAVSAASIGQNGLVVEDTLGTRLYVAVDTGTADLDLAASEIDHAVGESGVDVFDASGKNVQVSLYGFDGNDVLLGGSGDDIVSGGDGNDTVHGGDGADLLSGGTGIDTITGGGGSDVICGGVGDDSAVGGLGADTIAGDEGADTLSGGDDDDVLSGGDHDDELFGGSGTDTLDGGTGADLMVGAAGNDAYFVDAAGDEVVEVAGEGIDTVSTSINLTLAAEVEKLILLAGAIQGAGNGLDNQITGNSAANVLYGHAGDDTLDGGAGADVLYGGDGNDSYIVDDVADSVNETASGGIDTVFAGANWTLDGHLEHLTLIGAAISGTGNALDNSIGGNTESNLLDGGLGQDTMAGGFGDDTYVVDQALDVVVEAAGAGTDVVKTLVNYTLSENVEKLVLLGAAIMGTGNESANQIIGNDFGNVIAGGGDSDLVNAGLGDDVLHGDAGTDTLYGDAGNDTAYGDDWSDQLYGGDGNDALFGGTSIDVLEGGAGNDQLFGEDGNDGILAGIGDDTADGGAGDDKLYGGEGDDALKGGSGNDLVDGGVGQDSLAGGAGLDQIFGDDGSDVLQGGGDDDALYGGAGDDSLDGGAGHDGLAGGIGNDTLAGAAGNDTLNGGDGDDALEAGDGNDVLTGEVGADTLAGGASDDTLTGGDGQDHLLGGAGWDNLDGGAEADLLDGGADADSLAGAGGNDTLTGGDGEDHLSGGEGNDLLQGGSGHDVLMGGAGNDTLFGGEGADVLDGGEGTDRVVMTGTRADYVVTLYTALGAYSISDNKPGAPEGIDLVSVEEFDFAGDVLTQATVDAIISDDHAMTTTVVDNGNGTETDLSFVATGQGQWTYKISGYDTIAGLRVKTYESAVNSDGTHSALWYDVYQTRPWETRKEVYDAEGRLIKRQDAIVSAAGLTLEVTEFDPADVNAQAWSQKKTVQQGSLVLSTSVVNDDGSIVTKEFDPANLQPWTSIEKRYLGFENDASKTLEISTYDDGSKFEKGWDVAQTETWERYEIDTIAGTLARNYYRYDQNTSSALDDTGKEMLWDYNSSKSWYYREIITDWAERITLDTRWGDDGKKYVDAFEYDLAEWNHTYEEYDGQGRILLRTVFNDDGLEKRKYWDYDPETIDKYKETVENGAGITTFERHELDDGSFSQLTWANDGNQLSSQYVSAGVEDYQLWDYGVANNWKWYSHSKKYDGNFYYKQYIYDDNTRIKWEWDLSNAETWKDAISWWNSAGQRYAKNFTNDDGTKLNYSWDFTSAAWDEVRNKYDALNRLLYKRVTNDNGSVVQDDYDPADGKTWKQYHKEWNSAGTLVKQWYIQDNGTKVTVIGPVAIDLDGDGVELQAIGESGVAFDWTGDGVAEATGWIGADDGFLVIDVGGDGIIDQRREIALTDWAPGSSSDLEALGLAFDSNNDGTFDKEDTHWSEFRIWQDANQNGVVNNGELLTLGEVGLREINLIATATEVVTTDGSMVIATGSFTWSSGQQGTVGDVVLAHIGSDAAASDEIGSTEATRTVVSAAFDEILTGSAQDDTFVFDTDFGHDVITDFTVVGTTHDVIAFTSSDFENAGAVLAAAEQVGQDVVIIKDAHNIVTLKNVVLTSLQAEDFRFI